MTPSEILNRAADLIRDTAANAHAETWHVHSINAYYRDDRAWLALMSPKVAPALEAMLRAASHDVTVSGMVLNSVLFKAALSDRFAAPLALARAVLGLPAETS
jgi:hypothetical protein